MFQTDIVIIVTEYCYLAVYYINENKTKCEKQSQYLLFLQFKPDYNYWY